MTLDFNGVAYDNGQGNKLQKRVKCGNTVVYRYNYTTTVEMQLTIVCIREVIIV